MNEHPQCPRCGLDLQVASDFENGYGRDREGRMRARMVQKGPRLAVVPVMEEVDGKRVEVWRPAETAEDLRSTLPE